MKLFIDTADVAQIREAWSWGIIDGVTTNPTHVSKTGRRPAEVYREICDIVDGPISMETIGLKAEEIIAEGRELAKIHKNAVIKVVNTREGLKAVKAVHRRRHQDQRHRDVLAPAGAARRQVSARATSAPSSGRLDAVGHVGMDLVRQIKTIYGNYGYKTEIIVAAVRHPIHVLEAALAGAEVCTMGYDVLKQLYAHPLTDIGIEMFLNDWKKVPQA